MHSATWKIILSVLVLTVSFCNAKDIQRVSLIQHKLKHIATGNYQVSRWTSKCRPIINRACNYAAKRCFASVLNKRSVDSINYSGEYFWYNIMEDSIEDIGSYQSDLSSSIQKRSLRRRPVRRILLTCTMCRRCWK